MTDLSKLVVRLEAEIGKYQDNLDKANKQLRGFQNAQDDLLRKVAGGFAAAFTVNRLAAWGDRIVDNAEAVGKLSQRIGIGVESVSELTYAFGAGGIEAEGFATIMKKLNENISEAAGNANSDAARAFKAMGIEIRDATGAIRESDAVLLDIADRFADYEDGANKGAIATQLLGKQGEAAIPVLNGGAAGLRNMADEGRRLGAVIDEDLSEQAAEFNARLGRMRTLLIDGIGNRIAAELLPNLNALGEEFEETANKSMLLERTSTTIATLIKGVTDIALGAATSFQKLGTAIGASAASLVQAAQGNFAEAAEIWRTATEDNLAIEAEYQRLRVNLWKDANAEVLEEVKITAKKIKEEAPNLAGGKELADAARRASERLKEMVNQLDEQVATFGKGDAAALRYRLEIGNLSDEVKAAGENGEKLADQLIRQAEALEKLKNAKEVTDALAEMNVQILELQGNTAEATIADFDRKNAELVKKLREQGNEAGLKQLETLTKLIVAQADYNELTEQADRIQSDLARQEERLRNSQEAGAVTELQMQKELSDLRKKAADDLAKIHAEQVKIAEQSGNPALIEQTKAAGAEIENLRHQASLLGQSLQNDFEASFGTALKSTVKNIHDADEAFTAFINNVADMLLDLAIQGLSQQIVGAFANLGGGGGGGNWFATAASAFAGGRASGGSVQRGMAYRVNEKTPNSEWFIPGQSGTVVPAARMGGMSITQQFILQAPKGSVTRQTQMQLGNEAAKGAQKAMRRNG